MRGRVWEGGGEREEKEIKTEEESRQRRIRNRGKDRRKGVGKDRIATGAEQRRRCEWEMVWRKEKGSGSQVICVR